MKREIVLCFAISFVLLSVFYSFAEERITLTTYYPAPYGVYKELRADQMSIGSGYRNVALNDGSLIVSGNVGIGGDIMVAGKKPILIKRFDNKNNTEKKANFNTGISSKDYYCWDGKWVFKEGVKFEITRIPLYIKDGTWWAIGNWNDYNSNENWEVLCFRREVSGLDDVSLSLVK